MNNDTIAYDPQRRRFIKYKELLRRKRIKVKNAIPIFGDDMVLFLGARRGAGKSYLCEMIMNEYAKRNPKKRIFYISKIRKGVTDDIKLPKRSLRMDVMDDFIPLRDDLSIFHDSLMCFDDIYDSRLTKKQKADLLSTIRDLMENSRHDNISIIMTAHMFIDRGSTLSILNELSHIVVYPRFSNTYQIKRVLHEYVGLSNNDVDDVVRVKSRYVIISTLDKKYMITQDGVYSYS